MKEVDLTAEHDWMTPAEVAKELRCTIGHVRVLMGMRNGPVKLSWFRHGRRQYILRRKVAEYKANVEATALMRTPQWRGRKAAEAF